MKTMPKQPTYKFRNDKLVERAIEWVKKRLKFPKLKSKVKK
jgi:hypothetical protein